MPENGLEKQNTKDKTTFEKLGEIEKQIDKANVQVKVLWKICFVFIAKKIPYFVGYTILAYIFLGLYHAWGFEPTLLILLIGVLYMGFWK
jgi:hypothetical protein